MLHIVEIKRSRKDLTRVMAEIREWLDARRFEPDAFRCCTDQVDVAFRVEFKVKSEATACAETFSGRLVSPGEEPSG
jgi:hypothetical protein